MGIIDSYSDHSLYDIVNGDLGMSDQGRGFKEPEGTVTIHGFHIFPANDKGEYIVQYDGHVGQVETIDADDYDDVLELVDDLLVHISEINYRSPDTEAIVDYAGKIMTSDESKANDKPELYQHVPDDV